jgi:hypothetical protein
MRKRQSHWRGPRDPLAGAGLKPPAAAWIKSPGGVVAVGFRKAGEKNDIYELMKKYIKTGSLGE